MKSLVNWSPRETPHLGDQRGRYVRLTQADFPADGAALFTAIGGDDNDDLWRFIPFGPFDSAETLGAGMRLAAQAQNWRTHLLRDPENGLPTGMASYMRIRPEHGSAEVGCIIFSKSAQRTPAATEAMYLMARHLFDELGYRRYEWKCHNDNIASRRAAERLGFTFEGVFRNDMVVKGANRDTAWYSITDVEWPRVKAAFEAWLSPDNFNADQQQIKRLETFRDA